MTQGIHPRIRSIVASIVICGGALLLGAALLPATARADNSAAGKWSAQMEMPGGVTVDLQLALTLSGGDWTGTLSGSTPGEAAEYLTVENIKVGGGRVSFTFKPEGMPFEMSYRASYLAQEDRLSGTVSVAGQGQPLNFYRVPEVKEIGKAPGDSPEGSWVGRVKTPDGEKVDILMNIGRSGSTWAGTLEDPTMGLTTVMNLQATDTRISFSYKPTQAPFPLHFMGSYLREKDQITGTFSRHGSSRFVKFKRVPGTVALRLGEEAKEPARVRHDYHFAVTGRINDWAPLHITKDDAIKINDLTVATMNFDGTFKWFAMDGFNIFARYFRGGQNLTSDPTGLAPFARRNISADSYLQLDGYEFGIMGYLGNLVLPKSQFNPYLTAAIGRTDWALLESGRGSTIAHEGLNSFSGQDMSAAVGFGTEYDLGHHLALEFELLWRYFMTEDATKWSDTQSLWSNTHVWGLSAGLTFGF